MELILYQIDAFTDELFKGNPAAVCPLDTWLPDKTMQAIALENNLSETAFFVPTQKGSHIRWFTPLAEVDLCGHATLASAYVLFEILGFREEQICFESRSGDLWVRKEKNRFVMDFPSQPPKACDTPEILGKAFHTGPEDCFRSEDYIVLFDSAETIAALDPDMEMLKKLDLRGIIATAKGNGDYDFVQRCFFPCYGVPEDPVTGSAFTQTVPFWADRLGKTQLTAFQSSKRGGRVYCRFLGDRTEIAGEAVQYMEGTIQV